jgi:hypothetical protein
MTDQRVENSFTDRQTEDKNISPKQIEGPARQSHALVFE